jgi:hypothetical protein
MLASISEKELNAWAATVKVSLNAEALANFASRMRLAAKICEAWLADFKLRRSVWSMARHCANDGVSRDEATTLANRKWIEADNPQKTGRCAR